MDQEVFAGALPVALPERLAPRKRALLGRLALRRKLVLPKRR
jgi:hypothetical protein